MKVGVLALQGDVAAHAEALRRAGAAPFEVRTAEDLSRADALVIPGGESTTIRRLATGIGLASPLRERAEAGLPILGTCAGLILCAQRIAGGEEPLAPLVDITALRNAYGRQVRSFETDLEIAHVGRMRGIFIRAPWIEAPGPQVEILAEHDGRPVAARQGRVLLTAFHPELSGDEGLHRFFLERMT